MEATTLDRGRGSFIRSTTFLEIGIAWQYFLPASLSLAGASGTGLEAT